MSKTMLAAVFEREGSLELKRVPVPQIENDSQVLLRVEAVSICGTDVHILARPPRYAATPHTILGHEFTGTVVDAGDGVSGVNVGDRVVVDPNEFCGVCKYCRMDRRNLCEHIVALGIHSDGAFSEFCRVTGKMVHRISPSVPVDVAACVEPLACAVSATWKVNPRPGESVLVIGAGPIGLTIAMLSAAAGAGRIMIAERAPYRVAYAQSLGLGQVIDVAETDLVSSVREATGAGADVVFDVVGDQLATALECVRCGGAVVPFGVKSDATISLTQSRITTREVQVVGSWLANAAFPIAVSLLEREGLDMERLITHRFELARIGDGIQLLAQGEAIKVIIHPTEATGGDDDA